MKLKFKVLNVSVLTAYFLLGINSVLEARGIHSSYSEPICTREGWNIAIIMQLVFVLIICKNYIFDFIKRRVSQLKGKKMYKRDKDNDKEFYSTLLGIIEASVIVFVIYGFFSAIFCNLN